MLLENQCGNVSCHDGLKQEEGVLKIQLNTARGITLPGYGRLHDTSSKSCSCWYFCWSSGQSLGPLWSRKLCQYGLPHVLRPQYLAIYLALFVTFCLHNAYHSKLCSCVSSYSQSSLMAKLFVVFSWFPGDISSMYIIRVHGWVRKLLRFDQALDKSRRVHRRNCCRSVWSSKPLPIQSILRPFGK